MENLSTVDSSLKVLQVNLRHSSLSLHTVLEFSRRHRVAALLLQDIPHQLRVGSDLYFGYRRFLSHHADALTTAILLRRDLQGRVLECPSDRVTGVVVRTSFGDLGLLSGYIQPHTGRGLSDLQAAMAVIRRQTPRFLLGLDGNGHSPVWGPVGTSRNRQGIILEDFFVLERLHILNSPSSPPTFFSDQGHTSWIDITAVSLPLVSHIGSWAVQVGGFYTDHFPILTEVSVQPSFTPPRRVRDWRHVDWPHFRAQLNSHLSLNSGASSAPTGPEDLDALVLRVTTALQSTIEDCVRLKTVGHFSKPWWSEELWSLRHNMNRAHNRWFRTRHPRDRDTYLGARKVFRREVARAKSRLWHAFCDDTSSSDLWDKLRRVSGHNTTRGVLVQHDGQGATLRSEMDQAHALQTHFFPNFSPPEAPHHRLILQEWRTWAGQHPASECTGPEVSLAEVERAVLEMRALGAPGMDGIVDQCFRECKDVLYPLLQIISQASLHFQYFPRHWKDALVCPIPKPGKDPTQPQGYRPISLLAVMGKVVEKIVQTRLAYWLESTRSLHHAQYGFRRLHSAEMALWRFISAAHMALQRRRQFWTVSLDLHKAYDTVWHQGLLVRMARLGVPPYITHWTASFLSARAATIRVGEGESSGPLGRGVPQGSPLSPLLFLIFLDPVLREVGGLVDIQAYADDILLWVSADRQHTELAILQQALGILESWAEVWQMSFSPEKCIALCMSRLRRTTTPAPLQFCGNTLRRVSSFRYLGITIDAKLTWQPHVEDVSLRAMRRLREIQKFSGKFWGAHPIILSQLVSGAVLPMLYYAAPVWVGALTSRRRLRPLERVLRVAGIMICGLLRTSSTDTALLLSGLLPPDLALRQRLVTFWLRSLTVGVDIASVPSTSGTTTSTVPWPVALLRAELRALRQNASLRALIDGRQQVEQELPHPFLPWCPKPPISSTIPSRAEAPLLLRHQRSEASDQVLWIFSDGSCTDQGAAAAALLSSGNHEDYFSVAHRFQGLYSSTQMELHAIRLGLELTQIMVRTETFSEVRIVTDSQAAILSISGGWRRSELVVSISCLLWDIFSSIPLLSLLWVPGHSGVVENEAADSVAHGAAVHSLPALPAAAPLCKSALKTHICLWYHNRMQRMWDSLDTGHGLRACGWQFISPVSWTRPFPRLSVSLLAQFLSDHFPCRLYLYHWHLVDSPACRFCAATLEDRDHIFLHCPRYDRLRASWQQHSMDTLGSELDWRLDALVPRGLQSLAGFVHGVKRIWDGQVGGTSWGPGLTS